jgi:glycosyltransferase involved in cell wall biosynthesis
VNVAGYFKGEFGVGQFGRLVARAAINSGIPVTSLVNERTDSRQHEKFEMSNSSQIYSVTISAVNADQFSLWLDDLPHALKSNSKFVGVWAWEIETFPKHLYPAFDYVEEIWAISNFVKDSIQPHTEKPVYVVPGPIIAPTISERLDRNAIGLGENEEYILFMFDYFSVFERKNPIDVIRTHILAFPDESGPKLIIKTVNGSKYASQQEKLRFAVGTRADILIIDKYLSREQLHSLMNECQIYISLHRSEGYGLTLAEAMSLGKPVVATAYSGNMDFMNESNSVLVPYELVPVGDDAFPYEKTAHWAQPDIDFAAKAVRELSIDSDRRIEIGEKAKYFVTSEFTMDKTSDFVLERVKHLHKGFFLQIPTKIESMLRKVINLWRRI